jgi:hypothetical protein
MARPRCDTPLVIYLFLGVSFCCSVKGLGKGPGPGLYWNKSSHEAKLRMDLVKPVVEGGHYRP